jgi:ubiquinone/menaquinone biosynthesis C-methylase UbiE
MTEEICCLKEREEALELAEPEDREILDVGAGPLARMAVSRYDCFVTNIDTSREKLDEAEADARLHGVGEKISFELADVTDLPFGDESFDIGIIFGTLHHLSPEIREQALDEVARVVYERLVVAELNPEGYARFHGESGYGPVDLGWLEARLGAIGTISLHLLGHLVLYRVEKRSNG